MTQLDLTKPLNLSSREFHDNQFDWYDTIREQKPVCPAKISVIKVVALARYDDCTALQKDPTFVRNRTNATGGSRFPIPLPKSVRPLGESMITSDDPEHRRLRNRLQSAFKPQAIAKLEKNIEIYTEEKLDSLATRSCFLLQDDYAKDIPIRMISEMLGLPQEKTEPFQKLTEVLSEGLSGWRVLKSLFIDLPAMRRFADELIVYKRANPGDDILTDLIETEDESGPLTENELVAMIFLLVVAGFETTVQLINNGVKTLFEYPDSLEQLRAQPELINTTVEEILRHRSPIQSSKPVYASQDTEIAGVEIKRGTPVMPLYASANHDPEQFENPALFDITRTPNRHLGFGHGIHFCLGAHLARAEARIGLNKLFERFPNLTPAIPLDKLEPQLMPGWYRFQDIPLKTTA